MSHIIRFVATYITIYLMGLIMEVTREKIHYRLKTSKSDLEIALKKIQKNTDEIGKSNQQLQAEIQVRKRIEKALRDSESFLDDIIESIQDGISVLNPDLTIRHTNSVMNRWNQNNFPLIGKKCYEQKMEAVGTLAGGVAHDLNNILSGIVSYPELLLMKLPEDSPMRKTIQTIQKSGQKVAAIVQDLLTLARRGVPIHEVVNLNDIISSFLKSLECDKIREFHQVTMSF